MSRQINVLISKADASKANFMRDMSWFSYRLTEWDLEEFEENKICFTFLENEFALTIHLKPGLNEPQIKDIEFQARQRPGLFDLFISDAVHFQQQINLNCCT